MYDEWSDSVNKVDLARNILDFAHQRLAIEIVLDWAKENNPGRYETHKPYLANQVSKNAPLALFAPDNDLGHGISLGGTYRGIPLQISATAWAEYGSGLVRSGWLFVPQLTESHAVAFFKLHLSSNGQGYIHLVDVANPVHNIWITTRTGFRQEKEFHFLGYPTDVWEFSWKH